MDYKAKYQYEAYNDKYPILYEKEKERIGKALIGQDYKIEHFGSTSIPNVGGKGIIDIYIATRKEDMPKITGFLTKVGYEMRESGGNEDRIFHQRAEIDGGGKQQIYHVHVTHYEYPDYQKSIKFRDFLRSNPDLALEYSEIKKKASEEALKYEDKDDMKRVYMEIKQPVIEKILQNI